MGKRKGRSARNFQRAGPRRRVYPRFLVVCEGEKTEPDYFQGLRREYRLPTVQVDICGKECRADPIYIVEYARERFEADPDYERVYCVFDKDNAGRRFEEAIKRIEELRLRRRDDTGRRRGWAEVYAVPSVPCFEIWLLLHYEMTTRPFGGAASPCDQVIRELRKHLPDYRKGDRGIFDITSPHLEQARNNAHQLGREHSDPIRDNPYTKVHELVEAVLQIGNGN